MKETRRETNIALVYQKEIIIIIINLSPSTCFTSECFDNEILWMLKKAICLPKNVWLKWKLPLEYKTYHNNTRI